MQDTICEGYKITTTLNREICEMKIANWGRRLKLFCYIRNLQFSILIRIEVRRSDPDPPLCVPGSNRTPLPQIRKR